MLVVFYFIFQVEREMRAVAKVEAKKKKKEEEDRRKEAKAAEAEEKKYDRVYKKLEEKVRCGAVR